MKAERRKFCTLGTKFWVSDNGGCTIADIGGQEKKRAEERFRKCGVLSPDEEISSAVEAVSFDDTLGEMGKVIKEGLSKDRVMPANSVEMYEIISNFREMSVMIWQDSNP